MQPFAFQKCVNRNLFSFVFPVAAVAITAFGFAVAPTPAIAAAPQDTSAQFGMVDVGRLLNDSKSRQAAAANIQKLQQTLDGVLRRLAQGSAKFLTESEINELAALYEKATPTDAEKSRISALEGKGDTQQRTLTGLRNNPKLDDTQTAQLDQINDSAEKGTASLRKLQQSLEGRLQDQASAAQDAALKQVRIAVAKIAKAKNLAVVFTGDVAIYAANDITEEVLKELNK